MVQVERALVEQEAERTEKGRISKER